MRTGGGFSHVATKEKRSFDGGIVDDSASTTDARETVNGRERGILNLDKKARITRFAPII